MQSFPKRKAKRRYDVSPQAETRKINKARFVEYGEFFARYIESAIAQNMHAYFVTLTTQNEFTIKAARSSMNSYIHKLTRECEANLRAIWCAEPFDLKEGYHLHALMCTQVPKEKLKEVWRKMNSTQRVDASDKMKDAIHTGSNEKYISAEITNGSVTQARSYFSKYDDKLKNRKSGGGAAGEYCAKYIFKSMNKGDWDICDVRQYDAQKTIENCKLMHPTADDVLFAHTQGRYYSDIPKNSYAVYIGEKF